MNSYFVKTPKIIRSLYKNYIWSVPKKEKVIYLTFDDGPTPTVTNFVLDTLKKHNAKASFFCIGKNIEKHPQLFKSILNNGHTVGNHTQNHLKGWKTNTNEYLLDVENCQKNIDNYVAVKDQKLFRPPYGKIKNKQSKALIDKGYRIIMWSVLSGDFDTKINSETCLKNVVDNTGSGSIVVFHDSEKAFKKLKNVLPKMITHFASLGFVFKAI